MTIDIKLHPAISAADMASAVTAVSHREYIARLRKAVLPLFRDMLKDHVLSEITALKAFAGKSVRATVSSIRDYTSPEAILMLATGLQTPDEYFEALRLDHYGGQLVGLIGKAARKDRGAPERYIEGTLRAALRAHLDEPAATATITAPEAAAADHEPPSVADALTAVAIAMVNGTTPDDVLLRLSIAPGIHEQHVKAAQGLIELRKGREITAPSHVTPAAEALAKALQDDAKESAPLHAPIPPALPAIEPHVELAIDALLNSASLPKLADLKRELADAHDSAAKAHAETEALRKRLSTATRAAPAVVKAAGPIPEGRVEWREARKVLAERNVDVPAKLFSFDIPVWRWEDEHPHVPAVDADYEHRPEVLAKLLYAIATNRKMWIWGHSGTGKSSLVQQVAGLLGWPFARVNMDSEITRMDLIGKETLVTDASGHTVTRFEEGILPRAISSPTLLMMDELDFARSDIIYVMQRVLEDQGLMLMEDGGRVVQPHPYFRLVATANTTGAGDESGLYQGARVQSAAFLDRFTVFQQVDYLDAGAEDRLVATQVPGLPDELRARLMSYVKEHREAFKQAAILKPLSPRGVLSTAQAMAFFTNLYADRSKAVDAALDMTILSAMPAVDAQKCRELIDRVFNGAAA